jgi:hypothetical protein
MIGFAGSDGSQGEIFPLASKVLPFQHVNQPDFDKSLKEFKYCCPAFREVAKAIGHHDLVEEYLTAKIWPLTFGWMAKSLSRVKFGKMAQPIPCPQFGHEKPTDLSD